jgi:tetratricopeptide (TPR) repeat protein
MTVAAKDGFSAARGGTRGGLGSGQWRRLWQVPLLMVGIAGFGFGVRAVVRTIKPVPFERQVQGVESLLAAERFGDAVNQINILVPHYKDPKQQGELEKLSGDTLYLAQKKQESRVRENDVRIMKHYSQAAAWGLVPTAEMNERWGETALALGDAKTAMEKLEAAIEGAGEKKKELVAAHVGELTAAYMEAGKREKALALVNRLLEVKPAAEEPTEVVDQRTWGLCKRIEIAMEMKDAAALDRAVTGAREAMASLKEKDPGGRVLVWIGRAELEKGQTAAAERDLTEARKRFAVHHIDDGRAAILLGKILAAQGELVEAAALYKEAATGQVGTTIWAAARLGRAEVAVRRGTLASEEMLGDYQYVIKAVTDDQIPVGKKPEMIGREMVRVSLLEAYQRAWDAGKMKEALTFLTLEGQVEGQESSPLPETVLRLAMTKERRGIEMVAEAEKTEESKKAKALAAGRAMLADAARDYLTHSKMTTLADEQSGNSLWKAAGLLDTAGETMEAAAIYERFTIQRPRDARVPDGLLALGRLYESAGMTEKALGTYERNIKENPSTPAAYTSVVYQARCYATLSGKSTKAEEKQALMEKAEGALLSLVQDNTTLLPTAREFRESLLALGDLYYANGRWADAVLRLDEVLARYPNDPAAPRVTFMLAEAYRKSAAEIAEALTKPAVERRGDLERLRGERLLAAVGYYTREIGLLDAEAGATTKRKLTALEEGYVRASYLNRAECLFLRGEYEYAVKSYDVAAGRYSEEVTAVQAYVQIVNAYLALKQPAMANAAAERGQQILARVPEEAFVGGPGRAYYQRLLAMK